jgi:nucleotide-binding universal stress UspA family protein
MATHADAPPRRLLLATDLCAGCDRPLDRARQLAQEWRAEVTVLMVREGPGTPEEVASWLDGSDEVHAFELAARSEVAEEFAGSGVDAAVQVAHGDVTDGILAAAAALDDALVVIGASRDQTFRQAILGSTAGRLAQRLAQPVLLVRRRARGSYERILVANDFSAASCHALDTAMRLFPGRRFTLLHVLEDGALAPPDAFAAEVRRALAESERFLERCALPAGLRERIDVEIGHGNLSAALHRHVAGHGVQLAVIGVPRHSAVARVFIGSRSEDLLRQLSCDTLLVRAAQGGADD